jgi:hypothetical protein
MTRQRVDAVTLVEDAMIHSYALRIVDVALKGRVPVVVGSLSSLVEAGGFMSYGPNRAELWRRAALLTDKILRGAKPGDLRATLRVAYAGSGVAQDAAHLFTTGMEHSPTSSTGTGWQRTPWHATRRAAWDVLNRSCESTIGSMGGSSITLRETRLCEAG